MKTALLFILVFVTPLSLNNSWATQDVESPDEILGYLRMLLVVPEISNNIVKYSELGCSWDDQVIWGGSPSEESLATGIFWKTLSMKFTNASEKEMWIQFAFSSKDGKLIDLKNVTDKTMSIDCAS